MTDEERSLIYFCSNRGSAKVYSVSGNWNGWNEKKKIIAKDIEKIRHWNVCLEDYVNIPNIRATWFIDPPYQFGGHRYEYSNKSIDFNYLGAWCREREGQIIVCENTKADWLPFKPLKEMHGQKHTTIEAIYENTN